MFNRRKKNKNTTPPPSTSWKDYSGSGSPSESPSWEYSKSGTPSISATPSVSGSPSPMPRVWVYPVKGIFISDELPTPPPADDPNNEKLEKRLKNAFSQIPHIRCQYCQKPNAISVFFCEFCGASLV